MQREMADIYTTATTADTLPWRTKMGGENGGRVSPNQRAWTAGWATSDSRAGQRARAVNQGRRRVSSVRVQHWCWCWSLAGNPSTYYDHGQPSVSPPAVRPIVRNRPTTSGAGASASFPPLWSMAQVPSHVYCIHYIHYIHLHNPRRTTTAQPPPNTPRTSPTGKASASCSCCPSSGPSPHPPLLPACWSRCSLQSRLPMRCPRACCAHCCLVEAPRPCSQG